MRSHTVCGKCGGGLRKCVRGEKSCRCKWGLQNHAVRWVAIRSAVNVAAGSKTAVPREKMRAAEGRLSATPLERYIVRSSIIVSE